MKKIITLFFLLMDFSTLIYAQSSSQKTLSADEQKMKDMAMKAREKAISGPYSLTPEQMATQETNELNKLLNFTPLQLKSVKGIFLDQAPKMTNIARDAAKSGDRNSMPKIKAINAEAENQLNKLLTDSQKKKYAQIKEQADKNSGM